MPITKLPISVAIWRLVCFHLLLARVVKGALLGLYFMGDLRRGRLIICWLRCRLESTLIEYCVAVIEIVQVVWVGWCWGRVVKVVWTIWLAVGVLALSFVIWLDEKWKGTYKEKKTKRSKIKYLLKIICVFYWDELFEWRKNNIHQVYLKKRIFALNWN
jgi:hypothetical protein